eukprot:scaffold28198_cov71-Phaeocystis_antarctica.AAC.5
MPISTCPTYGVVRCVHGCDLDERFGPFYLAVSLRIEGRCQEPRRLATSADPSTIPREGGVAGALAASGLPLRLHVCYHADAACAVTGSQLRRRDS